MSSKRPLREWRISIMRDKTDHLGRVMEADKEAAIGAAMKEYRVDPARRFKLVAEPTE